MELHRQLIEKKTDWRILNKFRDLSNSRKPGKGTWFTGFFVYRKPPAVPGSSQKALALHRK